MSLSLLLDTTCNVERETATADALGSNVPSFAARLSGVACAVQAKATPRTTDDFSRPDFTVGLVVWTATDIAATRQDRIKVNGGPFAGTYPVVGYVVASNAMLTGEVLYTTYVIKRNAGG